MMIESNTECDDLLQEALEVGAVDRWKGSDSHYEFHVESHIFRMRRADGSGFLKALIERRRMELLRTVPQPEKRAGATEGAGEGQLLNYHGYAKMLRRFVSCGSSK